MSRKNPLKALRLAMHGWAFADLQGQVARLKQAEEELACVDNEHKQEAVEFITPLRKSVRAQTK